MKFCKKYEEYMQIQRQKKKKLPGVGFKKLKKILKRCRNELVRVPNGPALLLHDQNNNGDDGFVHDTLTCPEHCTADFRHGIETVCDETFFPSLLKEMSEVVGFFNEKAKELLEQHLSSGFNKCFLWLKEKLQGNHVALIQECRDLVTYAMINAVALRKILKKYDKIHYSKQGQAFKSQVQTMHVEILQSPWLWELIAFHLNTRGSKANTENVVPSLLDRCSLIFDDGKPSLSCELFDSVKLDIDLTCSICLDTLFDPVSLTCGHIFCYMCACKAASVTIVDGLKRANPSDKCPICREGGVNEGAVHLEELHILLSRSCPEYWQERRKSEKEERLQQAKEHWEAQCRLFTGV